ncbi:MAG: TatD family hydrolase [Oscillospiraceae bacterium]|nr:TatD family hydrolase [Oscillospiraceae bacterium]
MGFTNIFDAHAHYDDEKFSEDRETLLSELPSKGVVGVVNAAVDIVSAETALSYGERYPFMYAAVGVHPENLEGLQEDYLDRLAKLYEREKAVAIGEIGLDYYWDIEREPQQRVFGEQLSLVNDLNAPVVIHDRDAHGDTLAFLKKYRPKKALLHCFSGSAELMRELMRLDCYISLGGTVTFKNARHSVEVAREVPIDKLLLETDAPYLTPVPFRGKRNDSSLILYTATKIAQIRGMSVQEVLDKTAENAKYFYGIK